MTDRARALRRDATPAERLLWRAVRNGALNGAKARRQVPAGPYILDFAFAGAMLAIEVDGDTHDHPAQMARDATRDAWLTDQGWRVLRFGNRDVVGNLEGVLATIVAALAPHPGPLPRGEGAE